MEVWPPLGWLADACVGTPGVPRRPGGAWPPVMLDPRVDVAAIGIDAQDVLARGLGVDVCDAAVWRSAPTPALAHDAAGDADGGGRGLRRGGRLDRPLGGVVPAPHDDLVHLLHAG